MELLAEVEEELNTTKQVVQKMQSKFKLKNEVLLLLNTGLKLPKESRHGERGRPETSIQEKNEKVGAALMKKEETRKKVLSVQKNKDRAKQALVKASNLASAAKSRLEAKLLKERQVPILRKLYSVLLENTHSETAKVLLKLFRTNND